MKLQLLLSFVKNKTTSKIMSLCLYVYCVCLFLCHALKDRTAGGGGLLCVADAGAECFMFWFLHFFIIIFFYRRP